MANTEQALKEALELGLEAAEEVAAETHQKYAGYKPNRHAYVDECVGKIKNALAALTAASASAGAAQPVAESELYQLREQNAALVKVWDAVANLIKQKGRHNTEIAYQRLVTAYDEVRNDTAPQASQPIGQPVKMNLYCPACGDLHIDEGEWATRPHKTHQCQSCKHEWRPFEYSTVGVNQPVSGAELTGTEALIRAVIAKCKHAVVWGEDLATAEERIDDFTDSIVEELLSSLLSASGQSSQSEKAVRDAVIDQCKEALDNILFGNMDADAVFAALEDLKGSEQSTPAQQTESERLPGAVEMLIRAGHSLEEATKLIDDTAHQPEAPVNVPVPEGWINVTERLPTHIHSVLGYVTSGSLTANGSSPMRDIVSYDPTRKAWLQNVGDDDEIVTVSHWAPLPAAPAPAEQTEAQPSIAAVIGYPDEWDTAAYPTLESALNELASWP